MRNTGLDFCAEGKHCSGTDKDPYCSRCGVVWRPEFLDLSMPVRSTEQVPLPEMLEEELEFQRKMTAKYKKAYFDLLFYGRRDG